MESAVKKNHYSGEQTQIKAIYQPDIVTAVLESIKVEGWQTACKMAKAWYATDSLRKHTCSKAYGSWQILNERYFKGSPLNGRWVNPIMDFYENCKRATEYEEGSGSLEAEDTTCATFVIEALKWPHTNHEWNKVDKTLKNDPAFARRAAAVRGDVLKYMKEDYQSDRGIVLAAVKSEGSAIKWADKAFCNDPDIALAAVTQNGEAYLYVHPRLQKQSKYVMAAIKSCPYALQWAPQSMKQNKKIVLAAVRKYGAQLRFADWKIRNDREVVLTAVKNFPMAIQYASYNLRDDFEVFMNAVQKNGAALEYAGLAMRNNREIVIASVQNYPRALGYASLALRDDYNVVMEAVTRKNVNDDAVLRHASERLRANVNIVRAAVRSDVRARYYSLEPAKSDEQVVCIFECRVKNV